MAASDRDRSLFTISFHTLANIACALPIFGVVFCVTWSMLYDFQSSTRTHCGVPNYLPSISSAIGGYTPQRYVWRICIALHSMPRFLIAFSYFSYHTSFNVTNRRNLYTKLAGLCTVLNVVENLSLIGLTYISSVENSGLHEFMFISFMVSSQFYMLFTCIIYKWSHSDGGRKMSVQESKSFKYKLWLFIFNVSVFLIAVYLFFRHNKYCEPGVYSWFATFEYLTVFSNIAFHRTACLDFSDNVIAHVPASRLKLQTDKNT